MNCLSFIIIKIFFPPARQLTDMPMLMWVCCCTTLRGSQVQYVLSNSPILL